MTHSGCGWSLPAEPGALSKVFISRKGGGTVSQGSRRPRHIKQPRQNMRAAARDQFDQR